MNRSARKRLIIGLIVLALIGFGLFLYFNRSQTVVSASSAQIVTNTYDVGAVYSGQVTESFVQPGDHVSAGQKLFYINSAALAAQQSSPSSRSSNLQIPLTSSGEIIIEATKPGTVEKVNATQGSFVPTNAVLATIAQNTDLRVIAKFRLSPGQYAAIGKDSFLIVDLPSGQTATTKLANINIESNQNEVMVDITGDLDASKYSSPKLIDGAPVNAQLQISKPLWQQWF